MLTTTPFARFLEVANEAYRTATPEQRAALRTLSLLQLPIDQRTLEVEKIMGWVS